MAEEISKKAWDWLRQKLKGMFSPLRGHTFSDTVSHHGTLGYVNVARITLNPDVEWYDYSICFVIDRRNMLPIQLSMSFVAPSATETNLRTAYITRPYGTDVTMPSVYIHKASARVFDIWVSKTFEYDIQGIREIGTRANKDKYTVTYPMSFRTTAISGWTEVENSSWSKYVIVGSGSTGINVFENGVRRYKLEASRNSLYARKYDENGTQTAIEHFCITEGYSMSGEAKCSFGNSWGKFVMNGSGQAVSTTVPNLFNEVRYSSGCMGSVNLTSAYTKGSVTISAGWYNFLYIPHRSGGLNGQGNQDNHKWGQLILIGMTVNEGQPYIISNHSGNIGNVKKVTVT